MAVSAHLERRIRVRSGDEMTGVSLDLISLRRVAAVTAVATGVHLPVCAAPINRNDFGRLVLLAAMAGDAIVFDVCGDRDAGEEKTCASQAQPR